jgi:hypothetical protein
MDDGLDQYIAEKRRERAEHQAAQANHQAAVERLDRLIAKLEEAAALRREDSTAGATAAGQGETAPANANGGDIRKPEGAISHRWRGVLRVMAEEGNEYPVDMIAQFAANAGIVTNAKSVRDRMREYVERGFVATSGDGYFAVTDTAIERFNLRE